MRLADDELERLRPIGWSAHAPASEALDAVDGVHLARVIGQHRNAYLVATGADQERRVQPPPASTRPRFPPERRAVVGDWVTLDADGTHIVALLPRHSLLQRAAAGEHYRAQPIAANIDRVFIVTGLDHDFNLRRIERYLVVVQASGAAPVVVLTKTDLDTDSNAALDALEAIDNAGVPVHAVNAKSSASVAALHPYLGPGSTGVLVGSSGAGKSTLTNTLLGIEKMKTGTVRDHDSRGRHTTTRRALIPLPQGGCLIDTPGMRELKLIGDEIVAEATFDDIEALAARCRFRDCAHLAEPGCAVRAALESAELDPDRYANYCKLRDERDAAATTLAERRAEERTVHRGFHQRLKDKYGRR